MTRLDDYQSALRAVQQGLPDAKLLRVLDSGGPAFVAFIVDHGLGPLWHERTGRDEFRESRFAAEALFAAQERSLLDIDTVLGAAGIEYAVIKGAANRLLLYETPAVRACYDLDLLVRPADRVRAASALVGAGFEAAPAVNNISRELVLTRGVVDIDLHWGLLREGRLRSDLADGMISNRRRSHETWMLAPEAALFLLLVHPAFAKHLAGWNMGLHRVADIVLWLRQQPFDGQLLHTLLAENGVKTAAWATLAWVQTLMPPDSVAGLGDMLASLQPGRLRKKWLRYWLNANLSERTSGRRWVRLLGFSSLLHDSPRDSLRALAGRYRAYRRTAADLAVFEDLSG